MLENNPLGLNALPSRLTGVAMSPPQLGRMLPLLQLSALVGLVSWQLWLALPSSLLSEPVWPRLWPWWSLDCLQGLSALPFRDSTRSQLSFIRSSLLPPQFTPAASCWGGWLVLRFTLTLISSSNGQPSTLRVLSSEQAFSVSYNMDSSGSFFA